MKHALHETTDAKLRPLVAFAVALALLSVVILFAMRALFTSFAERERAAEEPLHPLAAAIEIPPEPRLQPMPGYELPPIGPQGERPFATSGLAEHREKEREMLESYGWVDRAAGVVRVPIERAIDLTLAEGLPIGEKKR